MFRRALVGKYLKETNCIKHILDLGCGEGALLGYLIGDTRIEQLTGVDLLKSRLELATETLSPSDTDHQFLRETPLSIELYEGSICSNHSLLTRKYDVITCIEVIEHLTSDNLKAFPKYVFGFAPLIIITTPNAEFNVNFPGMLSIYLRIVCTRWE